MNMRKILVIIISTLGIAILVSIMMISLLYFGVRSLWCYQEKIYYSDKENFITERAVVDYISYDEEYGYFSFCLSEIDEVYQSREFVIEGDSVLTLLERGITEKITIGSKITYTSAPKYFGDGYNMPIVAISVGEEELLSFDEGYENLMKLY